MNINPHADDTAEEKPCFRRPLSHKGTCTVWGSFHLFTRFWGSSMLWHVSVFYFYCWMIFRGRDSLHFVFPLISWRTFKLFPLFRYYKQCCSEHLCTSFCVAVSFLLGIYLGVEFLGHMVTLYLVFWGIAKQSSKVAAPQYMPTSNTRWAWNIL